LAKNKVIRKPRIPTAKGKIYFKDKKQYNRKKKHKQNKKEIFEENGQWYFWDETWANRFGPYKSYEKADKSLDNYIETFLKER